jgi:inositol-phosphate phosphatase/L-galactose 1-phosphate phosphatase/histidinol-phosphatase
MTAPLAAELVALADELADAAGEIIRRWFRQPIAVDDKPDASPVTIADRDAEAAIRARIEARFPAHGIIGEEHGRVRVDAEFVWVLDPIDGTKSFISGVPLFGTLIALLHRGAPVLGVIDQPIARERWIGAAGRATTLNGAAVRVRACPEMARATLFATAPDMFRGAEVAAFERLRGAAKLTRFGADCYAYGLLAAGFIDCVAETSLQLYDYAALVPVVTGAGGVFTDWEGRPLGIGSGGRVLACGDPRLHAEALRLLTAA